MIKKDKLPNFGYKTQQFGKHSIDSQCSTTTEPTQTDSSSPVEDTDTYNKDQKTKSKNSGGFQAYQFGKRNLDEGPTTHELIPVDTVRNNEDIGIFIQDSQTEFPFFLHNGKSQVALHGIPLTLLLTLTDIPRINGFKDEEWRLILCKLIMNDPDLLFLVECQLLYLQGEGIISNNLDQEDSIHLKEALWHWNKFKLINPPAALIMETLWNKYMCLSNSPQTNNGDNNNKLNTNLMKILGDSDSVDIGATIPAISTQMNTGTRIKLLKTRRKINTQADFPFFWLNGKRKLALHGIPLETLTQLTDIPRTDGFEDEEWRFLLCKVIANDPDTMILVEDQLIDLSMNGHTSINILSNYNSIQIRDAIWYWVKFKFRNPPGAIYMEALWMKYMRLVGPKTDKQNNKLHPCLKPPYTHTKGSNELNNPNYAPIHNSKPQKTYNMLSVCQTYQLSDNHLALITKGKSSNPRPCTRWKIINSDCRDTEVMYTAWKRRRQNYCRNKRKLHLFCSNNNINPNKFKFIDIDHPSTEKIKEYITNIKYCRCSINRIRNDSITATIISNGTLTVRIPYTFWVNLTFKKWSSRNAGYREKYFLEDEQNMKLHISTYDTLISSLQYIHNKLLMGFLPDADLKQQTLSFIKTINGHLPSSRNKSSTSLLQLLVSWIDTWDLNTWSLQTDELQNLKINIKLNWRKWHCTAHLNRSPQRHSLRETMTNLKSVCTKLHLLLRYLEEMQYSTALNNWNYSDINSINLTYYPTFADISAAQLILESALNHLLHALSHTNRVFGKRELKQTITIATYQYNLLQPQINSICLFDLYISICSNLSACHSLLFSDMDLTLDLLTRQQNQLPLWLLNLWSRTKETLTYTFNSHTDLLIRIFEAKEYKLSLSAASFAETLPSLLNQVPESSSHTTQYTQYSLLTAISTDLPPQTPMCLNAPSYPPHAIQRSDHLTKNIQDISLTTLHFKSGPLTTNRKIQIKILITAPTYYTYHGTILDSLPTGKFPYSLPLPPYRRPDNRTGIG